MGMTFLAAGTSVPEAVSSVVVTAQGYGSMGISNSIGSNTFDILLCLGLPWLIKTLIVPSSSGQTWVKSEKMSKRFLFSNKRSIFRSRLSQQAFHTRSLPSSQRSLPCTFRFYSTNSIWTKKSASLS